MLTSSTTVPPKHLKDELHLHATVLALRLHGARIAVNYHPDNRIQFVAMIDRPQLRDQIFYRDDFAKRLLLLSGSTYQRILDFLNTQENWEDYIDLPGIKDLYIYRVQCSKELDKVMKKRHAIPELWKNLYRLHRGANPVTNQELFTRNFFAKQFSNVA